MDVSTQIQMMRPFPPMLPPGFKPGAGMQFPPPNGQNGMPPFPPPFPPPPGMEGMMPPPPPRGKMPPPPPPSAAMARLTQAVTADYGQLPWQSNS